MAMQLVKHSLFLPLFSHMGSVKKITKSEFQSQPDELTKLIRNTKNPNNLVYVCKVNFDGKLDCHWIKACVL